MSTPKVGDRVRDFESLPELTIAAYPGGGPAILHEGVWFVGNRPVSHVPTGAVVLRIGDGRTR
jgi:hypothetical protein